MGGAVDGDVNGDVNGHVNTDAPEGADLTPRSALEFPPCACGHPKCPDTKPPEAADQPKHDRLDDRSFSPVIQRLRPKLEEENARWGWRH